MSLQLQTFPHQGGADGYPPLTLVERSAGTNIAFIDPAYGNGTFTTFLDQGMQEEQVLEVVKSVGVYGGYMISIEAASDAAGELSIYDGAAWQGPFQVPAGEPMAMFGRFVPAVDAPFIRIKFRSIQAAKKVFVRAAQACGIEQVALANRLSAADHV